MANVFCYPGQLETTLFGSVVGTEEGEVGYADRMNQHGMGVLPRSESPWGVYAAKPRQ